MRGAFAWLDAHPGFYWVVLAVAIAAWLARFRAVAERGARGAAVKWDFWLCLAASAVVAAGRWPALFVAHGVTEEEARVVLGARTLLEDWRPFRSFVFTDGGPLASAALLPTHWLGVPQDYFNGRLVALLADLVALGLGGWLLARRVGAVAGGFVTGALALVLAWPGGQLAGAVAQHLCLALAALAFVLLEFRSWKGIDLPAIGAGLVVGLLPWVHRDAAAGSFACVVVGAALLGEPTRRRLFAGAAVYSLAVFGAWIWSAGAWQECWQHYVLGEGEGVAGTGWWREILALVAVVAVAIVLGKRVGDGGVFRLATAVALTGLVAALALGRPAMLGQLSEHWRHPRIGDAARIRSLTMEGEAVAIWGDATAPLVEAGRGSAMPWRVTERSTLSEQERWFDHLRRKETAVLLVAGGPAPEKLRAVLQDFFRLESAEGTTRIYLRNERMFAHLVARPEAVPIDRGSLIVAEAFGGSVTEIGAGKISTHAPARLVARVPAGVRRVAGIFGFYPDAYRHPGRTTDGGRFSIIWWRGSQRETAVERWLTPANTEGDRGAQEFGLEIPADVDAVEFKVDSGATKSFDWAYWGELRFSRS